MKHYILRGALSLLSILVLIGCQKEKESTPSFVDLSKVTVEVLNFDATESSQEIELGLPEEGWYTLSDAEWVKATKNGTMLIVSVISNQGLTERVANLNLVSGSQIKTISIHQSSPASSKDVITPDVSEIVTDQQAGNNAVYVTAVTQNWHAVSSVDWLTVKSIVEHSKIEVSYEENQEIEQRIGEIQILDNQSSQILQKILVKQDGAMYFILPYQEVGADLGAIRAFETERKSTMTGKPDGFNNQDRYTFTTMSRIFKNMVYYITGNYFHQVDVELNSEELQQDGVLNKIIAFLEENGYVMQDDGKTLINEEKALKAFFGQDSETQAVILHIQNNPVQPQAYKTFESFPPHPLFWNASQKDEIAKYEESIGSKVWEEQQKPINQAAKEGNKEVVEYWYLRSTPDSHAVYFLNGTGESGGGQIVTSYNEVTLGFYEFKGQYFMTNEFRTLLEKNGFSISEYDYSFKKYDLVNSEVKYMTYVQPSRVNESGPNVMWLSAVEL